MNLRAASRVSALIVFAFSASVANAQLSSRSANGGLFGSLVTWLPAADGSIRVSPFAASQIQLGSVRAADPRFAWTGNWSPNNDRAIGDAINSERSLRTIAGIYSLVVSRTERLFPNEPPARSVPVGAMTDAVTTEDATPELIGLDENGPAFNGLPLTVLAPHEVVSADVIVNPEPETYVLAAFGLLVIALIRRSGLA